MFFFCYKIRPLKIKKEASSHVQSACDEASVCVCVYIYIYHFYYYYRPQYTPFKYMFKKEITVTVYL